MAKHILVPYDGSDPSKRAFETACELSTLYNANITVITCLPIHSHVDPVMATAYLETLKIQKEEAMKTMKELEPKLKKLNKYKTDVLEAISIPDVLLSYAKSHNVDLIVIGSRGLGGFKKLLLGSVASTVSQHSECPVLIVK